MNEKLIITGIICVSIIISSYILAHPVIEVVGKYTEQSQYGRKFWDYEPIKIRH